MVHRPQFARHFARCAGHAGDAQVTAKKTLIADARQGFLLPGNRTPLLGLDHLVQPALPRAVGHDTAGVLVDDLHLAGAHDVLLVALEQVKRRQGATNQLFAAPRPHPHPAIGFGQLGGTAAPAIAQFDVMLARPDDEVRTRVHLARHGQGLAVDLLFLARIGAVGNDERRARLVDKHTVCLVDDDKAQAAQEQAVGARMLGVQTLDLEVHGPGIAAQEQAVLEVVEHQLLVGAVGDVACVGGAALLGRHALGDGAHRQAEKFVHRAHPGGVAHDQEVVDGNDMHRDAGERRRAGRQGCRQGLAFARLHLGDLAFEHHAPAQ